MNLFLTDLLRMFQAILGHNMNLLDKSDLKNFLQKVASGWACALHFYLTEIHILEFLTLDLTY